jgi:hypothetical protein
VGVKIDISIFGILKTIVILLRGESMGILSEVVSLKENKEKE